jgi:hypothetical protein
MSEKFSPLQAQIAVHDLCGKRRDTDVLDEWPTEEPQFNALDRAAFFVCELNARRLKRLKLSRLSKI